MIESRAMRIPVAVLIAVVICFVACGGGQPPAHPGVAAPVACDESAPPFQPDPSATPDPMLLSWKGGTIVRSYPASSLSSDRGIDNIAEGGPSYAKDATGPFVFIFELAGPAAITSFSATLPPKGDGDPATVDFAVSRCDPHTFRNVGTLTADGDRKAKSLPANVTARWVRVTATGPAFGAVGATGVLAPLPSGVSPVGIYVEAKGEVRYKQGAFISPPEEDRNPWYVAVTSYDGGILSGAVCKERDFGYALPGQLEGRVWAFQYDGHASKMIVSDDASRIVGRDQGGNDFYLERTTTVPKLCTHRKSGSGPRQVLVLDGTNAGTTLYPIDDPDGDKLYTWDRISGTMFDATSLAGKDIVVMNMLCDASLYLAKAQTDAILRFVAAGHELLIDDADVCHKTKYDFLPYPFATSNPGAAGGSGTRLLVVESDALGSTDSNDSAHYFDPQTYLGVRINQLGDANTVTTSDPHWCGHAFGTNALNTNGFMQMYSLYEKGVIVYDGFDRDDAAVPGYKRLRLLELSLPVPSGLACTQKVSGGFVIEPDQEGTYVTGTAQTLTFNTELLANQGWKGHVNVTATAAGGLTATVTPASFDVTGGTQPLTVSVSVPASANAPSYTVSVAGTGPGGTQAEAVITLTPTQAAQVLQQQLQQPHVVIYGIHFDVDSARIQPRSETIIDQIAKVMTDNPTWRFQVEGHTDSDAGAAYNLGLSQRRAQAVVDDLVTRKAIERSRLVPMGFGLTRPVATNDTQAGKALNRRVELTRL
jgi:outer membrane protein OmpA-like peptidoglycan-associated protein